MKKILFALSVVSALPVQANWWEEEAGQIASNSQVYNQACEDLALQYALEASMEESYARTNVETQKWLHETFNEGPNSAYALVRTQNGCSHHYGEVEKNNNSFAAQRSLMTNENLSEDQLFDYALELSKLDRSGVGVEVKPSNEFVYVEYDPYWYLKGQSSTVSNSFDTYNAIAEQEAMDFDFALALSLQEVY